MFAINSSIIYGQICSQTLIQEFNDTLQFIETISYHYDDRGNLQSRVQERDSDNDGIIDRYRKTTYVREYDDNEILRIYSYTIENNNLKDSTVSTITLNATYDDSGKIMNYNYSQIDESFSYFYNSTVTSCTDSIVTWTTEDRYISGLDTLFFSITYETEIYNEEGRLIKLISELDNDNDGTIDSKSTWTYTYDDKGNRLSRVRETDNDNDGTIDFKSTWTYDEERYVISFITENDLDDDGIVDEMNKTTYTRTYSRIQNESLTVNICSGESYDFYGEMLTTAGKYSKTFTGSNECDSIINLNLAVNEISMTSVDTQICAGTILIVGGMEFSDPGQYQVTLSSTNQCDSIINLTLTHHEIDAAVKEEEGTLSIDRHDDGNQYQWIDCDDQSDIPGATDQLFKPDKSGDFAVRVMDENGCSRISSCYSLVISDTRLEELNRKIVFYPNPTFGRIYILNDSPYAIQRIRIFDNIGRFINSRDSELELGLDMSDFESGIYILEVDFGIQRTFKKIFLNQQ